MQKMGEMKLFRNMRELNEYHHIDSRHPLLDIRRFADLRLAANVKRETAVSGFYKIVFIQNFNGYMQQGDTKFDDTNGVLYFITPGQKYSCTSTVPWEGYQILLHPDLFKNHLTEKNIDAYNFFSYEVNESLLLTAAEEKSIQFLMHEAWDELNNKNDDFSISIILSYISILFNNAERFYHRQFETRKTVCNQLTSDFFTLLKTYYDTPTDPVKQPSVFFFSEKLHVTPNYLSDMIRHHTGKSALTVIHEYIIEEAKLLLKTSNESVAQISTTLGFEYPNYFSRLFKKKTAVSPSDFRKSVKSI